MKKLMLYALLLCLTLTAAAARADGILLKTVSTFAGSDAAAETYAELLKAWQETTGHTVLDVSATSNEAWKTGVLKDFAAGNEADVLFFFARTAESAAILSKVVPVEEINAAYPGARLPVEQSIAEKDGKVYAVPVRPYWEGLFCNVDLFERYGLELPTTWERLAEAVRVFRENGIVPIAVSLSDVPHYLAEFCILSCGSTRDYQHRPAKGEAVPQSWLDGMALIHELYEMGAFSANVNATTEAEASQLFREKKAAMQIDGSWFANTLAATMNSTVVMPFPARSPQADPTAYIYGLSMGFYLTRAAWREEARRDAAVDLLAFLTTGENGRALGYYDLSGSLRDSYYAMVDAARERCRPIQDDMTPEARGRWFASIPGIADGTVEPAQMWAEIMAMNPFQTE